VGGVDVEISMHQFPVALLSSANSYVSVIHFGMFTYSLRSLTGHMSIHVPLMKEDEEPLICPTKMHLNQLLSSCYT